MYLGVASPSESEIDMVAYKAILRTFDACVCEALAVGQASAGRIAVPHVGYGTHIFTRICSHAIALVRAAPKSRWISSDAEFWDFAAVAGHARSIIEGYLLFVYLTREPVSTDEWSAKLNVMHLNDCAKRMTVLAGMIPQDEMDGFESQAEEIRGRLRSNAWFLGLSATLQGRLLTGRYLTIPTRDEELDALGWDRREFNSLWDILSQYTHVLPFSFYRLEPNGRGTGIENETDRAYIAFALAKCTEVLSACIDDLVSFFPDVAPERRGLDSKFSPGPRRNLPRHRKRGPK